MCVLEAPALQLLSSLKMQAATRLQILECFHRPKPLGNGKNSALLFQVMCK